jgi:hypothetical protein
MFFIEHSFPPAIGQRVPAMPIDDIYISVCEIFFVIYTRLDASGKSNILSARGKKQSLRLLGG